MNKRCLHLFPLNVIKVLAPFKIYTYISSHQSLFGIKVREQCVVLPALDTYNVLLHFNYFNKPLSPGEAKWNGKARIQWALTLRRCDFAKTNCTQHLSYMYYIHVTHTMCLLRIFTIWEVSFNLAFPYGFLQTAMTNNSTQQIMEFISKFPKCLPDFCSTDDMWHKTEDIKQSSPVVNNGACHKRDTMSSLYALSESLGRRPQPIV